MPTIRIPAPLRALTDDRAELMFDGTTVAEVLDALTAAHPATAERIRRDDGRLHRFVNVFVGDDDVRDLQGLATRLDDDDVVAIVPAVAGG